MNFRSWTRGICTFHREESSALPPLCRSRDRSLLSTRTGCPQCANTSSIRVRRHRSRAQAKVIPFSRAGPSKAQGTGTWAMTMWSSAVRMGNIPRPQLANRALCRLPKSQARQRRWEKIFSLLYRDRSDHRGWHSPTAVTRPSPPTASFSRSSRLPR